MILYRDPVAADAIRQNQIVPTARGDDVAGDDAGTELYGVGRSIAVGNGIRAIATTENVFVVAGSVP